METFADSFRSQGVHRQLRRLCFHAPWCTNSLDTCMQDTWGLRGRWKTVKGRTTGLTMLQMWHNGFGSVNNIREGTHLISSVKPHSGWLMPAIPSRRSHGILIILCYLAINTCHIAKKERRVYALSSQYKLEWENVDCALSSQCYIGMKCRGEHPFFLMLHRKESVHCNGHFKGQNKCELCVARVTAIGIVQTGKFSQSSVKDFEEMWR